MIEEYYLLEGNDKKGPYTLDELQRMDIGIHTEIITPQSDAPQYASNLPEFIEYFEAKGIYFPTGDNLAPVGSRVFAFIIDYFILCMVVMLALTRLGIIVLPTQPGAIPNEQLVAMAKTFSLVSYPAFLFYNVLFEISKLKATPGKLLCKIMVVDIDGQPLKIGNSLVKNLGVCLSLFIYALPFLSALFDEHRQTWYERIAKSYQITKY